MAQEQLSGIRAAGIQRYFPSNGSTSDCQRWAIYCRSVVGLGRVELIHTISSTSTSGIETSPEDGVEHDHVSLDGAALENLEVILIPPRQNTDTMSRQPCREMIGNGSHELVQCCLEHKLSTPASTKMILETRASANGKIYATFASPGFPSPARDAAIHSQPVLSLKMLTTSVQQGPVSMAHCVPAVMLQAYPGKG